MYRDKETIQYIYREDDLSGVGGSRVTVFGWSDKSDELVGCHIVAAKRPTG